MILLKLQDNDKETKKLRSEGLPNGWKDIKEMLYYQSFLYVLKVICSALISKHHDIPLKSDFDIKKT